MGERVGTIRGKCRDPHVLMKAAIVALWRCVRIACAGRECRLNE